MTEFWYLFMLETTVLSKVFMGKLGKLKPVEKVEVIVIPTKPEGLENALKDIDAAIKRGSTQNIKLGELFQQYNEKAIQPIIDYLAEIGVNCKLDEATKTTGIVKTSLTAQQIYDLANQPYILSIAECKPPLEL